MSILTKFYLFYNKTKSLILETRVYQHPLVIYIYKQYKVLNEYHKTQIEELNKKHYSKKNKFKKLI